MRIKETENLIPTGLGMHKTRSSVIEVPDDEAPKGAIETTEELRDWTMEDAS